MSNREIFRILDKQAQEAVKLKKTIKNFNEGKNSCITGLASSARSFVLCHLSENVTRPLLVITPDISSAIRYANDLKVFIGKKSLFLPPSETSPYEQTWSDPLVSEERLKALKSFQTGECVVLVSPAKNLLGFYPDRKTSVKNSLLLKLKASADPLETAAKLVELGYKRVASVMDAGEFSLRGDIMDVYPISENPVRIEFFCEEVENIKEFDTESQRSIRKIEQVLIEPRYGILISESEKQLVKQKMLRAKEYQMAKISSTAAKTLEETFENFVSLFEEDSYTEGIEYFAPFLDQNKSSIFDYMPKNTAVIANESFEIAQKLYSQDEKYVLEYEKNINEGLALELPSLLHIRAEEAQNEVYKFPVLKLDSFVNAENEEVQEFSHIPVPKFMGDMEKAAFYAVDMRNKGFIIVASTEFPQRFTQALKDFDCPYINMANVEDTKSLGKGGIPENILFSREILVSKTGFAEGFELTDANIVVITDSEFYNRKIKKPTLGKKLSKKENIDYITSINDLKEGDYAVHAKHGIGKFIGVCKQEIDGELKDYLAIEYAQSDRLYVPAEQINLLSRYRGAGAAPKLTRMGGAEWDRVKSKVKAAIADIADQLLRIYAKRAKNKGHVFEADSPWQFEIENAFPYVETPDQLRAINDTKADMESEKVMDRLICGDVGFGKTEVALRAVCKAVLSGKQSAIIAPTTILSLQHYNTFKDRLSPYPIKIELMSRFRTAKEQRETVKRLQTGECDIVIGTHRLLQKDVIFKNLGLLIVDEEHRFGVTHKEKIKEFKSDIDILTLSATPIPRTLNMALSGLREMSIINTPPVNRAPVKTYVGHYNPSVLRTALMHEIEREGQVYYLHNRVQSIYQVATELQELLPEARIAVAHGQMNEKDLERIMAEFGSYEYDILVCTTIIESGLDIPNANTLIVDDADRLGLAQMYQIRGRVGRSETQAYAYFFYREGKVLNQEAKDRLKAIKDFNTLGSGYQIALRDLEIRGVGNILGPQQHGHMVSVGFDLYCQLLEDTVRELKGESSRKKEPAIIDINITAFIPDEWVGAKEQKMIEYKRLADVKSFRELEFIQSEWLDRFGKLPEPVEKLVKVIRLRLMATDAGIILVREAFGVLRVFSNISFPEYRFLEAKLPPETAQKLKWTQAPKTSDGGSSVIIIKCNDSHNEEKLDILQEIFAAIISFKL